MTLTEVLGLGDFTCLAADDWTPDDEATGLRVLALGDSQGQQVANLVVDPETRRVWILELVEGSVEACWVDPDMPWTPDSTQITDIQALSVLAGMIKNDLT